MLLCSGYNFLPRRPIHWAEDGDVRNKTNTSEMARLHGTESYHGLTCQKRQAGIVMDTGDSSRYDHKFA